MKLNAIESYPQSAVRVNFFERPSETPGRVFREYYAAERVPIKLIMSGSSGGTDRMYSPIRLRVFERIMDIRNPAGESLLTEQDYGYQLLTVTPVLNPYGFREGYAYTVLALAGDALTYTFGDRD